MDALLAKIAELIDVRPIALARVISTSGSGPRGVGATMLVTGTGRPIGSLSAGCVEAVVIDTALDVISSGQSAIERFGYADPEGVEVGLTCGGEVEVFIERVEHSRRDQIAALIAAQKAGRSIALITSIEPRPHWRLQTLHFPPPSDVVESKARALLHAGVHGGISTDDCDAQDASTRAFVHSFTTPPRMILAGANDFVRALGASATLVGYHVTVVDARPLFATSDHFPPDVEVVIDWPHRYLESEHATGHLDDRTVICVMTHDARFDIPMLAAALRIETCAFVGALGSRRTHAGRLARLRDAGVTPDQIRLLNSPLGLDIGADTPQESAISILAQVIAQRSQASGRPLRDLDGPIHRATRREPLIKERSLS
jgi:xanthine dehydrogenase accessory factor